MNDKTLDDARQQLTQIRTQLAIAETVLARIRAHGCPKHTEKEASTRQLIEALSAKAEVPELQLNDATQVLH